MEIIPQIGLVLLLVILNGFFVASEFSLVAVRKTRIDELAKRGNSSAKLVQKSLKNLDTFISATQLGITLASLALGWIGEPAIAKFLEPLFNNFLSSESALISSHAISVTIAFSFITFLHIVLGELAPKTIALQKAEKTSLLIMPPLILFTTIFKPFIWFLNGAGNFVLKTVGFSAPTGHQLVHSEEEIKMILSQSAQEGAIEKKEAEMVYSVLKLGDIPVAKIMIPRTKIVAFEINTPLGEVTKIAEKKLHSRFPVYEDTIDNIKGFIHVKDIYKVALSSKSKLTASLYSAIINKGKGKKISQTNTLRKILKVSEERRIDDVLLDMRKRKVHIAVIKDSHGGTAGFVTLEDILEKLVGEIHDEFD